MRIRSTFLALLLAVVLMITTAGTAAAEDTPVPVRQSQPELYKVTSPPWGEAGPAVVFTADDGYRDTSTENGNTMDFFEVLDEKGVKGTFFWPVGFTYDDCAPENSNWGLEEGDVLAIAQAGHEIGTHGWCHEDYVEAAAASEVTLEETLHASQLKIYEKTGITPTTGAYPTGAQNERVRQIVSRNHDFYRASLCCVVSSPPDPYRAEIFDPVQASLTDNAVSLAAAKDMVRQAVAKRTAVVFLFHSSQDFYSNHNRPNYVWDVFPPLIDWLQDTGPTGAQAELGLTAPIPILPFKDMMMQRTAKRGTSSMEDTSGHAYYAGLRSQSVEVIRNDQFGDHFWMDYDESSGTPYYDSTTLASFRFKKGLTVDGGAVFRGPYLDASGGEISLRGTGANGVVVQRSDLSPAIDPYDPSVANASVLTVLNNQGTEVMSVRNSGTLGVGGLGNLQMGQAMFSSGGRTWYTDGNVDVNSAGGRIWLNAGVDVTVNTSQGMVVRSPQGDSRVHVMSDGRIEYKDASGTARYVISDAGIEVFRSDGSKVAALTSSGGLSMTDTQQGRLRTASLENGVFVWN